MAPLNPRASRRCLPYWRTVRKRIKEAATGPTAANGFRATGLFPCDKNIFRPHDFPPVSGNTDAAPVNHPALVKTSVQPSFSSSDFSPFTSVKALRASDISPVPSLNLKPNPRGGTAKKIRSSPYKKFVQATQKEKIKEARNSKNLTIALNALLGPSERRKRSVCWDPNPSDTPSDSDIELTIPLADDATEEGKEQDVNCLYCTGRFSEDHNGGDWIKCAQCFRWAHHALCWCGGRFCLRALSRINTVFFIVCIFVFVIFLIFCNHFLCKLFTSPN